MSISRLSLTALLIGALLLPSSVLAQTSAPKKGEETVIATVNIYNAKIVSQTGRTLTIAFDLTNREGVQSGVKYGVSLVRSSASGQLVADEKVFDEVLTLGAGASVHREITYAVPEQISGTYDLFVSSENSSGMPFGSMLLGTVTFYPSVAGAVSIDPSSCSLTVKGDTKNTRYSPSQGVDISETESINAHCTVLNTTKAAVTLTPSFVTNYRDGYGAVVAATGGESISVALLPNEHKEIVVALPKAAVPQAYDVTLALSAGGKVVSNNVKFHYVLRGASATIQNVLWDKENYQQGDTATVSFSWAPSADTFRGARAAGTPLTSATVELNMVDEHGVSCSAPVTANLSSKTALTSISIVTTAACVHPNIRATIKDATHGVLATGDFSTAAPTPVAQVTASGGSSDTGNLGLIITLVVLMLGVIIFFAMKQKGKGAGIPPASGMMLLALMIAGGMFGAAPSAAHADTWEDAFNSSVYTGNLDKASYSAGEMIVVTGTVQRASCNNGVTVESRVNVDGVTIVGQTSPTYGAGIGPDVLLFSGSVPSGGAPANGSLTAPATAGGHQASFGGRANDGFGAEYAFHDIPFTVAAALPPPPPFVTLTQSPSATVVSGTNGFISWNASNGPTCSIVRDGVTIATGQPASVANYPLGVLTANTALDVTCTNAGGSDMKSVTFTVTPVPSATISATNCTIGSGLSTCNSLVTWAISTASTPNVKQDGTQFSVAVAGASVPRPVSFAASTFTANDGATQLESAPASGSCIGGTSWNGSICAALAPTGALTASSPSCTITVGESTCTVDMTWVSANTLGIVSLWETNTPNNLTAALGSVPNRALPFTVWVSPLTTYELRDGATVLDTEIITGSCAVGSTWNGASCVGPSLGVNPPNLDYGTLGVTEVRDRTLRITNTGGGTLTGALSFVSAPSFACVGICAFSLLGGAFQDAVVRFTAPAVPGPLGAEIVTVNSNVGNLPVPVFAIIVPVLTINPGPLNFGDVVVTKFKDLPLTISNTSTGVDVPAGSITVAAPFSCVPSGTACPYAAIPRSGSTQVTIRYSPTVVSNGQTGTGNLSPGAPQDNTADLVGNGMPLSFKVNER